MKLLLMIVDDIFLIHRSSYEFMLMSLHLCIVEFETRARVYHALHWISKHVCVLLDLKMCNNNMFSWFVRVIGDASCTVL